MPLTLDEVFIPACQQMLGSISGVLRKAEIFAQHKGISENDMLATQLSDDMRPLPRQIQGMWAHSVYAIDQVKGGAYRPNAKDVPTSWDGMQPKVERALHRLDAMQPAELDTIAKETVHFVINDEPMFTFTVRDFLLSFNLPNVHFHATTAYGHMRMRGVDIGKFNFLGAIRTKAA